MFDSKNSRARLYFTYLKDKTELFLYVNPHGTTGSEMTYRRSPGDAAMNLRIRAILDHAGVNESNTEIWILLYPPEIHTTTLYIPSHASSREVRTLIREQMFSTLPYPVNYDWDNYSLTIHENGNGENMVTVTILGKDVLPRIQSLLNQNYSRVRFIGDGLQFLNLQNTFAQQLNGQTYEMILPYDEMYYVAAFRSGIHIESSVLTHACSSSFGHYELNQQQVYLDFRQRTNILNQPEIQPVVPTAIWKDALLTPSAFPTWFIARNSMNLGESINFVKQNEQTNWEKKNTKLVKNQSVFPLLD